MKKRRWFWIALFIIAVCVLGTLATSWNVTFLRGGHHWIGILLGSLGFIATFTATLLFFIKLLKEMKLNQLQTEFLAQVSHELKTPLATIELTSSLLKDESTSPQDREKLWDSHNAELQRLKREVETLLEAARWETQPRRNPPLTKVPLERWLQENWNRWQTILGPKAMLVRQGLPFSGYAMLNPDLMALITNNLIDNARKFAKDLPHLCIRSEIIQKSLPRRWYDLRPPKFASFWRLHFEDQGWGFQPRESRKVFTRFYRAKSNAPYAIAGTGLGLHLALNAAKTQRLSLTGSSKGPSQGACFTIEGRMWNS